MEEEINICLNYLYRKAVFLNSRSFVFNRGHKIQDEGHTSEVGVQWL